MTTTDYSLAASAARAAASHQVTVALTRLTTSAEPTNLQGALSTNRHIGMAVGNPGRHARGRCGGGRRDGARPIPSPQRHAERRRGPDRQRCRNGIAHLDPLVRVQYQPTERSRLAELLRTPVGRNRQLLQSNPGRHVRQKHHRTRFAWMFRGGSTVMSTSSKNLLHNEVRSGKTTGAESVSATATRQPHRQRRQRRTHHEATPR